MAANVQKKIKIGEAQAEKTQVLSVLTWTIRYIESLRENFQS
jgi:hypothetical protein